MPLAKNSMCSDLLIHKPTNSGEEPKILYRAQIASKSGRSTMRVRSPRTVIAMSSVVFVINCGGTSFAEDLGRAYAEPMNQQRGRVSIKPVSNSTHILDAINDFGASGNALILDAYVTLEVGHSTLTLSQYGNYPTPNLSKIHIGLPIQIGNGNSLMYSGIIAKVYTSTKIAVSPTPANTWTSSAETVVIGQDDTLRLQAAFDASSIQPVFVPCGLFRVTHGLSIPFGGFVHSKMNNPYYYYPGSAPYRSPGNVPPPCAMIMADPFSPSWGSAAALVTLGGYVHLEGIGLSLAGVSNFIPVIYGQMPFNEVIHNLTFSGLYGVQAGYNRVGQQNQGWVIDGNDVSSSVSDGIRLDNTSDTNIVLNWVHSAGGSAISLNSAGSVLISLNVLEDNRECGINVYGGDTESPVVANKIAENALCGIRVDSAAGEIAVSGNEFAGNGVSWIFNSSQALSVVAAANEYQVHPATLYQGTANSPKALNASSSFVEHWPLQKNGIFGSAEARALLQPMFLLTPNNLAGPYADDIAAARAGVPVGAEYKDDSGIRRQRVH